MKDGERRQWYPRGRRRGGWCRHWGKERVSKVNAGEGRDKVTNGNTAMAAAAAVVVTAGLRAFWRRLGFVGAIRQTFGPDVQNETGQTQCR